MGAWSWTYIEGRGRMEFSAGHRVKIGFLREEVGTAHFWQSKFVFLHSGTWRLEGDVLVTETNDQLLWDRFSRSRLDKPQFETRMECDRIVQIDDEKMIFDDGSFLNRDHR